MEWQPIETAPKDGLDVLVYEPPYKGWETGCSESIYVCYYEEYRDAWIESGGEQYSSYEPTHWMPLPEPPK